MFYPKKNNNFFFLDLDKKKSFTFDKGREITRRDKVINIISHYARYICLIYFIYSLRVSYWDVYLHIIIFSLGCIIAATYMR